eukprot:scaffold2061_cov246-Pinguiococcus_pyrenoidosus.AAC.7
MAEALKTFGMPSLAAPSWSRGAFLFAAAAFLSVCAPSTASGRDSGEADRISSSQRLNESVDSKMASGVYGSRGGSRNSAVNVRRQGELEESRGGSIAVSDSKLL